MSRLFRDIFLLQYLDFRLLLLFTLVHFFGENIRLLRSDASLLVAEKEMVIPRFSSSFFFFLFSNGTHVCSSSFPVFFRLSLSLHLISSSFVLLFLPLILMNRNKALEGTSCSESEGVSLAVKVVWELITGGLWTYSTEKVNREDLW